MTENKYFMHRIKRANGTFDKGIEVKDTFEAAKQSYHAYLGAYAYGNNIQTDFVSCMITDMSGQILLPFSETWTATAINPQPEPEPEE